MEKKRTAHLIERILTERIFHATKKESNLATQITNLSIDEKSFFD